MATEQIKMADLAIDFADKFVATEKSYKTFVKLDQKATTALYTFLGEVFDIYKEFKDTKDRKKADTDALKLAFDVVLDERKAKRKVDFTGATSFEVKLLRFICGSLTEGREKAWSKVLRLALKEADVVSGEKSLALWLAGEGGIGQVGKTTQSGEKPAEKKERYIEDAMSYLSSISEDAFDKAFEGREIETEVEGFSVVVVYRDETGERVQPLELTKKSLVLAALAEAGKLMEEHKVSSTTSADVSTEIDAAIEDAVAEEEVEQLKEVG